MKPEKDQKQRECKKHSWELLGFGMRGSVHQCLKCGKRETGMGVLRDRRAR